MDYYKWNKTSAAISAILMLIAAAVRTAAYWGQSFDKWFTVSQIVLPYITIAVFVFAAWRRNLAVSAVAVLMGVAFFIIKSFGFTSVIHTVLCIFLYLLVLALYTLTVFGVIKTKVPLILAFALPLAEHIIQDIIEIALGADAATYLPEVSVLLIMASLLCTATGLNKNSA